MSVGDVKTALGQKKSRAIKTTANAGFNSSLNSTQPKPLAPVKKPIVIHPIPVIIDQLELLKSKMPIDDEKSLMINPVPRVLVSLNPISVTKTEGHPQ